MKKRVKFALATFWRMVLTNVNWSETRAEDSGPRPNALSKETRTILDRSEKFVLYSIDPEPAEETDRRQRFHRYRIIGQTEIKDAKLKNELLAAIYEGMERAGGPFASCFNPRHGIKATEGTNSVDLVICFECDQIVDYAGTSQTWGLKSERGEKLFNRTLKNAGVPLAKK